MSIWKATLVQHSAFLVAGNRSFEHAVEPWHIHHKRDLDKVESVGGVIVEPQLIEDEADKVNYPPSVTGMIPRARGTFSKKMLDGRPIYLPAPAEKPAPTPAMLVEGFGKALAGAGYLTGGAA